MMELVPYLIRGNKIERVARSVVTENGQSVGRAIDRAKASVADGSMTIAEAQSYLWNRIGLIVVVWPDPAEGYRVTARRAEIVPLSGPPRDDAIAGAVAVFGVAAFFQDEELIPLAPSPNAMATAVFNAMRQQRLDAFVNMALTLYPSLDEANLRDAMEGAGFAALPAVIQGKSEGLL